MLSSNYLPPRALFWDNRVKSTSVVSLWEPASMSDLAPSRDPSILIFIIAYTARLKGNLRSCDNLINTNIISYTINSVYKYNSCSV